MPELTSDVLTPELVAWMITPEPCDSYTLDHAPGAPELPEWVDGRIDTTRQGSDLILDVTLDTLGAGPSVRKLFKVTVTEIGEPA
jgi:hypothetical protein